MPTSSYGVQCVTRESILAEAERTALVIEVWSRARLGRPRKSVCSMCNLLRGHARRGNVQFRTMAEVCAVGCDTDEFRDCWPEPLDPNPTATRPGSSAKVELLARRFAAGIDLFSKHDFACRDTGD